MNRFKKIVITGAFGLIGSGCVRYLNDLGYYNLILVDDLDATDKWKNLLGKKYLKIIPKDRFFEWLESGQDEVDAFIHMGACSDTLESDENYLRENNLNYSIRLAEYALKFHKRFIYASSAATYGDGSLGFIDDHAALDTLQPLNLYGHSKHNFDLWLKKLGVLDRVVGLKYFNVFGPNENHKGRMASMVYKMLPLVQKEGEIRLYKSSEPERFADGNQCRDFIYVKDAVKMTCDFLDNEICGIFNMGSGTETTWNALASAVFDAAGIPPRIVYIEMPSDLKKQYQNYTCADMTKYQQLTGKTCHYDISRAVREYVQEYLLKDQRW